MKTFNISISTPIGKTFNTDKAVQLNADIIEGQIGVLAGHSPLVSSLKTSKFTINLEDGKEIIGVVDGGVFNVTQEEVSILTTRFILSDEVSKEETESEIKNLEVELNKELKETEQKSLEQRLKYENLKLEL